MTAPDARANAIHAKLRAAVDARIDGLTTTDELTDQVDILLAGARAEGREVHSAVWRRLDAEALLLALAMESELLA